MKTVFFSALLLVISVRAFSEENQGAANEVGLIFSSLNSFGLRYKCGNDNVMFRLTSVVLTGTASVNSYDNYSFNGVNDNSVSNSTSNSIGPGLNVGIEKRVWVGHGFCLYGGLDWINSFSRTASNTTTPGTSLNTYTQANGTFITQSAVINNASSSTAWTINSGLGVALGAFYKFKKSFSAGVELEPSITYKYTETTTSATTYGVHWAGNATTGYTPEVYVSSNTSQKTINRGFTGSVTNAAASIILSYDWRCPPNEKAGAWPR
jgi:hypothetical protein